MRTEQKDPEARDRMATASCMAVWRANAFLGLNHSLAHKLGAFHHIPHGIANALVLVYVMRYIMPTRFLRRWVPSRSTSIRTLERYCEIARYNGLVGKR